MAFPQTRKKDKIVVIAVNRCFDTVISKDLVKSDSVHGQFCRSLLKMILIDCNWIVK